VRVCERQKQCEDDKTSRTWLVMASARGSHGGAAHAVPSLGPRAPRSGDLLQRDGTGPASSCVTDPSPGPTLGPNSGSLSGRQDPTLAGQARASHLLSSQQTSNSRQLPDRHGEVPRASQASQASGLFTPFFFFNQTASLYPPEPSTMLVSLTVGKVDAGVTVLLTPDKRLARPPLLLLLRRLQKGDPTNTPAR